MDALNSLINLPPEVRAEKGVVHTPAEILQQPVVWRATREVVRGQWDALRIWADAVRAKASGPVILTGAGSSHYICSAVAPLVAPRLGLHVESVPSTEIVFAPEAFLPVTMAGLVSFARSGESPEGNAAFRLVSQNRPGARHLVITCNGEGELARLADGTPGSLKLVLPPETNDRSLAMTSSFTSLTVAGLALAYLNDYPAYADLVERLAIAAERVLATCPDDLAALAGKGFGQIMFLGSGALFGAAMEARLKVNEMTSGQVTCLYEGIMGLRHGPMTAIGEDTLVVYMLSSDPYRRQYEVDLMREVDAKQLGGWRIAIADKAEPAWAGLVDQVIEVDPEGRLNLPDDARTPVYVIVGQLLGLFMSLQCGLLPDSPGSGVINRTVQGVTIYSYR